MFKYFAHIISAVLCRNVDLKWGYVFRVSKFLDYRSTSRSRDKMAA